jgi:hypothetical protein
MRISGHELRVGLWPGEPTSVPLLIFNGIGSRLELLDPFVQWLDPDRKVIVFDVPGTGVINQIRAFLLERGIAVRQGLRSLRFELPGILATRTDVLLPRMLRIIEDLAEDCAGWMSVSRGYQAKSKRWPVRIRPARD